MESFAVQHHENHEGSGFPNEVPASKISPLSALFIVCHDLIYFLNDSQTENPDLREYFDEAAGRYDHGHFKHSLEALKKALGV